MKKWLGLASAAVVIIFSGTSFAGDWNLAKNVKRLERVSPDYQDDKEIDKKLLDVLDLTEKTRKDAEVYEEAKKHRGNVRIAPQQIHGFISLLYVRQVGLAFRRTI